MARVITEKFLLVTIKVQRQERTNTRASDFVQNDNLCMCKTFDVSINRFFGVCSLMGRARGLFSSFKQTA